MKRTLLSLATLSLLATASCRASMPAETTTAATPHAAHAAAAAAAPKTAAAEHASAGDLDADARKPGDFVIYRVSGSFRKAPLTLTERVVARQGDTITVDVTSDDGTTKRELRVRLSDAKQHRNEVLSVARLDHGAETPTTVDAYEALLAGTTLSADDNVAVLGSEDVKVPVGKDTIDARRTSFRVRVGKKHGTLRTLASDAFTWGDLGGEITTDAGKTLYKAEIVDAGHGDADAPAAPAAATIAIDE
ncbi:MAG TPA: hypothetical protein VHB21_12520 [Minicystis sp.]|nr:hypothetical protein [Minicystis sp.]